MGAVLVSEPLRFHERVTGYAIKRTVMLEIRQFSRSRYLLIVHEKLQYNFDSSLKCLVIRNVIWTNCIVNPNALEALKILRTFLVGSITADRCVGSACLFDYQEFRIARLAR